MLLNIILALMLLYFILALIQLKDNFIGYKVIKYIKSSKYEIELDYMSDDYEAYIINDYRLFCKIKDNKVRAVSIHSKTNGCEYIFIVCLPSLFSILIHRTLKKKVREIRKKYLLIRELDKYDNNPNTMGML